MTEKSAAIILRQIHPSVLREAEGAGLFFFFFLLLLVFPSFVLFSCSYTRSPAEAG
jgi:hypothetical protein